MGDGAPTEGVVGEDGCVEVCEDVDVGGARGVVPREDGEELSHTILVGGLDATKEGVILEGNG